MSEDIITVQRLGKWYGRIMAINDVSLVIQKGVTGLLGPNGAGKSTFFKVLTGLLQQTQGRVLLRGEPIWNNPMIFKNIGYCPEHDALFTWMTGREFLVQMGRLHGFDRKKADTRAGEMLGRLKLADVGDRRIHTYSKGMRQRLKIAQALLHDPEILFLDEPLNGTDPMGRRYILDLIEELGTEGKTVIVSSHILHEIERMTRRIILINKGRLVAEGNVDAIRDLIDRHPHLVRIDTPDRDKLQRALLGKPSISSIALSDDGRSVLVETKQPDQFYLEMPRIIDAEGIDVTHISSEDDSLDAVFRYIVHDRVQYYREGGQ